MEINFRQTGLVGAGWESGLLKPILKKMSPSECWKLAVRLAGINHWDLAEYWMQKAVESSPDYAEAWAFLAEARQQRGLDGKEQINRALELAL